MCSECSRGRVWWELLSLCFNLFCSWPLAWLAGPSLKAGVQETLSRWALPGLAPGTPAPSTVLAAAGAGGFGTTAYVFALWPAVHSFTCSFIVLSAYYVLGPAQTLGGGLGWGNTLRGCHPLSPSLPFLFALNPAPDLRPHREPLLIQSPVVSCPHSCHACLHSYLFSPFRVMRGTVLQTQKDLASKPGSASY